MSNYLFYSISNVLIDLMYLRDLSFDPKTRLKLLPTTTNVIHKIVFENLK